MPPSKTIVPNRNSPAEGGPSKKRGRPPGSKNKPKVPTLLKNAETLIIQVHAGSDIIGELIKFAKKINSGLTVLSAVGKISNAVINHPLPTGKPMFLNGSRSIMSLNGTIVFGGATRISSNGKLSKVSLSSSTSFSVCLAGFQGEVHGGVALGKLVAGTTVTVIAATFSNPVIIRGKDELENDENMGETSGK